MREVKIESLSHFISEIDKLGESYYRGEAKDFGETKNLASGYRWLNGPDTHFSKLIALREKYYQEIGYALSLRETENFISYAQHHGLPTELLDISENPLVSLFFACCDEATEDGFVYSSEISNTVDLDKDLINNNVSAQFLNFEERVIIPMENLFDIDASFIVKLCSEEKMLEYIKKFYPNPKDYNSYMSCLKFYDVNLREQYLGDSLLGYMAKKAFDSAKEICKAMVKYFSDENMTIDNLFNETTEWGKCLPRFKEYNLSERQLFTFTLFEFAYYIMDVQKKRGFLPFNLIIHEPSVKFDRMVNQQGKFIYQNYLYDNNEKLITQQFNADCIFKIPANRKQDLILQLDKIGINRKFIYPDHDNIAKYIKDKISINKNSSSS